MKRIALLLALFVLGLAAASFAVAQPPPGKGKDKNRTTSTSATSDPENCHPKVSVILKGDFVSGGGSSFTMDVKSANSHGRSYAGKPLTLKVDSKTSFKRNGPAKLADFKAGDRLNVHARACKLKKKDSSSNTAPQDLLAKRVVGHPAKASESGDAGDDG
jgi:hypothetical protein